MKKTYPGGRLFVISWILGLMVMTVRAGVIVPGLDDSMAIADYTLARNGVIDEVPDMTRGEITLAARFNPDVSQATGGPVLVIEIGGTSNGTGLYLANGRLIFGAKADNGRYSIPASMNDTDFGNDGSGKAMTVDLGPVGFGSENEVYVSMDLINGQLVAGINGVINSCTITNSSGTENLDGNHTISFLGVNPIEYGHMGGLLEEGNSNNASTLYPQLFWTRAVPMIQTAGYTNQRGQIFDVSVPDQQSPYSILVEESNGATTVQENGVTDDISISITHDPMSYPVIITLMDAFEPDRVQIVPSQVVFDTNNWQNAQSVVFTAVNDSAQGPRNHTAAVQFQVQVDPASGYFGYRLDDLIVNMKENDCGFWGYDQVDTNRDCQINIEDFLNIASSWLECTFPEIGCVDHRS